MAENKEKTFEYYTFEVGRHLPSFGDNKKTFKPYRLNNKKLVWNVIVCDLNTDSIYPQNIFEYNWVFLRDGLLEAKNKYSNNFNKFADHIRHALGHEYWARTEYEVLISSWPSKSLTQEDLNKLQAEMDKDVKYNIEHGYKNLKGYVNYNDPSTIKIDVYTQVMMNWDRFISYVWANKKLITRKNLGLDR